MPLLAYDQLRVEKPIKDEVRVKCYDKAMMGEFSQFEENSVGWTKALRLINYLLALPKRLKHKLHLVPYQNCWICEVGDMKWNLTVLEEDAERSLFRYET